MNRFSIKDIENLTGIKAHTIRIWEQRYGILQPKRTPSNIRYYDGDDLKMALRVALLNSFGYKISRIHQMSDKDMNALIQKITDPDFRLHAVTNELLEAALSLDIDRFEELLNGHTRRYGMEHTIEELLFRFLEKVGLMWMTDRLIPAQEHLASNIIYRKLAVAIEQCGNKADNGRAATVLLFMPEGELHDIGLMYVYYLLRKWGKNSIYLGANTPLSEAEAVYQVKRPLYAYLHLTGVAEGFDGNKYFKKLSEAMPDCIIFISGGVLRMRKYQTHRNIRFLHNLTEVKDTLQALEAPVINDDPAA